MLIASKNTGDSLSATEFDQLTTELEALITMGGLTPSAGDLAQINKSIINLVGIATYYTDGGTANAYVLSAVTPRVGATALVDGMRVRFMPGNVNTGASTLNLNGLGAVNIVRKGPTGANAIAGDLPAAQIMELQYNQAHNVWVIPASFLPVTQYRIGQRNIFDDQADFSGWTLLDGRPNLSRSTYASLFALWGTRYGVGDGSTTFGIEDMRGKTLVFENNSSLPNGTNTGFSVRNIGDTGGEEQHTTTTGEMPAHAHRMGSTPNSAVAGSPNFSAQSYGSPGGPVSETVGGGGAHNNMQPYQVAGNLFVYSGV